MTVEARLTRALRDSRIRSRAALALIAGVVGLLAWPTLRAFFHLSYAAVGRDTGIYQFVAWAMLRGQRPYLDLRENNGPLIYLIHLFAVRFGGESEHFLRALDVLLQSVAYAFAGFVAGSSWSAQGRAGRAEQALRRVLFGAFGVVVLASQYLVYDWWATAQRESTYNAVLLVGLSLQLSVHQRAARRNDPGFDRKDAALLIASGGLVAATWFGKPTYVACSVAQAGCLLVDPKLSGFRQRCCAWLGVGSVAMASAFLAFMVATCDLTAFVRIVLIEAPRYYVPIWRQTLFGTYFLGHNAPLLNQGLITLALFGFALAKRWLPRGILIAGLPLIFGLLTFFGQRKGFYYHLHPVTCGAYWLWVVVGGYLYDQLSSSRSTRTMPASAIALVMLCGACAYQGFGNITMSTFYNPSWMPSAIRPESRDTREFYAQFEARDFEGYNMRRAAEFLMRNTGPAETVQTYGLEPYLLFLAQRKTATPFIYLYDLNMTPALAGGPGGAPSAEEASEIRRLQNRNARDLAEGLRARPPGAFVLIDHAPMAYAPDALVDFQAQCPDAARWMVDHYAESAKFGSFRVFLPKTRQPETTR